MPTNPIVIDDEPAFEWDEAPPLSPALFEFRPPGVPDSARAIHDETTDAIIGYQAGFGGIFRNYDLTGQLQSIEELPLEAPLIDPLDAVLLVGTAWKVGSRLVRGAVLARAGVTVSQSTLIGLRTRFFALSKKQLRFTAKALLHMGEAGRFVPVHILRLAILYGKRAPDPRNAVGYFMYTITVTVRGKPYLLEVLVHERNYTIAHFLYK
ncbi:hypothetical protein RAS12_03110 [Achromobacter seleniivolatilans]|uniref:Uncharacterized protein n=1 Tax=Achromobacter seleniivolatilans TaxID=3047478 RepID=A0ABY9M2Z4_9BURK|nr:hypothetical protein [Achromobacter sp. R39]WMD21371.1 hypothetical protein RAS12_03110 [Achromobacter sp. R39]